MKTNNRILIIAVAAYSYLFYDQNAGINFLIFNILLILSFALRDRSLLSNKKWLVSAFFSLLTSLAIFVHSSALAIFANACSLLLLSAYSFNTASSVLFSLVFSFWSVITSFVYIFIDASKQSADKTTGQLKAYKALMAVVVPIFSLLFFVMYKSANPLFAENTRWITLDFISFPWILFTGVGFLIVYGLVHHKTIPFIASRESQWSSVNISTAEINDKKTNLEFTTGAVLFTILNLMLLVLNYGDIQSIWITHVLPKPIHLADFVHEGVAIIVLSIGMACALIMFLIRKNFTGSKGYGFLKTVIFAWIMQNLVMLLSTAMRNQMYIRSFDLTYLRIGVYVWLLIAAIGLALTFIKVYLERSNWYLIRSNVTAWLGVLCLASLFNWDNIITNYNLNSKPIREVDLGYLLSLSDSNIPQLVQIRKHKDFQFINQKMKKESITRSNGRNSTDFDSKLKAKITSYLNSYCSDWQSWDLRDKRITDCLME
jgi:hypothetical protein